MARNHARVCAHCGALEQITRKQARNLSEGLAYLKTSPGAGQAGLK